MKLLAEVIASAFACSIAIALWPEVANRVCSPGFVFGEAAVALLLGFFSTHLSRKSLNLPTMY
jgi:hypothetical protein